MRRRRCRRGRPCRRRTSRGSRSGRQPAKEGGRDGGLRAWSEGEGEKGARGQQRAGSDEEDVGALRGRIAGGERVEVAGPPDVAVGVKGGFGFVQIGVALRAEDGAGDAESTAEGERDDSGRARPP